MNPECQSWTWADVTWKNAFEHNRCFLKSGHKLNRQEDRPGLTSGIRLDAATGLDFCSAEEDVDYHGKDLGEVTEVLSAGECCDLCTAHSNCLSWTWIGSTWKGVKDHFKCLLKSGEAENRILNQEGLISGTRNKEKDITFNVCNMELDVRYDTENNPLVERLQLAPSAASCCKRCTLNLDCEFWQWAPSASGKECHLMGKIPGGGLVPEGGFDVPGSGLVTGTRGVFDSFR